MNEKKMNRFLILFLVAAGCGVMYFLPYMRWTLYDAAVEAAGLTNTQFAATLSAYGLSSMIFYFPGGYFADKFSAKKLLTFTMFTTGALGLWYSTFPSFAIQMLIYFLWGAITSACFWATMLKVAKSLGSENEQGRMFGFLEGIRGVVMCIITSSAVFCFSKIGMMIGGIRGIVIVDSVICLIVGVLFWLLIDDKVTGEPANINVRDIGKVLRIPAVWLISIVVLTCYSVFIGSTYLTPYMTEILGMTVGAAGAIAILRTYVFMFLGGPIGGIIADKVGSITKVIIGSFILIVIAVAGFAFIPNTSGALYITIALMVVCCVGMFFMRGIYFAPLSQCKVPQHLSGTAIGVISLIGFTPDIFMNTISGIMMDSFPGASGYRYIFLIMLAFAVVGLVTSLILNNKIKKINRVDSSVIEKKGF